MVRVKRKLSGLECIMYRAGGRAPRTPGRGWRPGQKGAPKSDRVRLLRHIETPELNSPRTDFTHFPFQYSYLSNMSKKFTSTRPITS